MTLMHALDQADLTLHMESRRHKARMAYRYYLMEFETQYHPEARPSFYYGLAIAESELATMKTRYWWDTGHYDDLCETDPVVEDVQTFVEVYRDALEFFYRSTLSRSGVCRR